MRAANSKTARMPSYRISKLAARDLASIYFYGATNFGQAQARAYHADLESCFQLLSEHPGMGQEKHTSKRRVRVFFHRSQVVVYQEARPGIVIVRVLGGRQDWPRILANS